MLKKICGLIIFTLLFCIPALAVPDNITAKSAAVVEQVSGRIIYGKNENARLPMASTTKIMTGILAIESGKLDNVVTIPEEALRVEGSSMGLVPGEKITLRDLTYGLLLESGNDAANSIAFYLGGSINGFVNKMNEKAADLNLSDTHFVTPSGLDADGHYTTAYDLARLGAYAMNNSTFEQIVSTQKIRVTYNGAKNARVLYNHNKMLSMYQGLKGIKTGFTKKCGRCLVTCAERDGVCIVVSTLSGPDDWNDHKKLLDYGFSLLKSQKLMNSPLNIAENVVGGLADKVNTVCDDNVSAALQDGEAANVKMQIQMPRFVYAPVVKGQKLGEAVFTLNNKIVARADIKAVQDVQIQPVPKHKGIFSSIFHAIGTFFKSLFRSLI